MPAPSAFPSSRSRTQRRRWFSGFTASLLAFLVLACGFREDELVCEQAVSRLGECCPGLDTSPLQCTYDSSHACTADFTVYPVFGIDEGACIRDASCEALVSNGVCARVAALSPASDSVVVYGDGMGDVTHTAVCP